MLDNRALNMTPGEALLDVPMGDIIERMGRAIADAQLRLDQNSVQTAIALGETRVDLMNAAGEIVSRSLLELGFTPTFYHFTETTIEIYVTLSIRVEEAYKVGATLTFNQSSSGTTGATGMSSVSVGGTGAGPTGPTGPASSSGSTPSAPSGGSFAQQILSVGETTQRASLFGLTVNAEYHRRYEFDTSASSKVTTKMLSVPPPSVFMDALRENFRLSSGG